MNIPLVKDPIDEKDINYLIEWLKTNPRLSKGPKTLEFEKQWSEWLGCKYSVFVNSGSSANLAMVYALKLKHPNVKEILVPAVSWATTVSPLMQLGIKPTLVDCDMDTLGICPVSLESILKKSKTKKALIIVHALGFPCKMDEIQHLCDKYNVICLEDSCETMGSDYDNKKTGLFGLMSTFSTFMAHVSSTIEGGLISTNNEDIYHLLLQIRSHGWDRDLPEKKQKDLRKKYKVDDYKAQYTFYVPGFNIRSTDLQAVIGLKQLEKLDMFCQRRHENFLLYQELIENAFWKPNIQYSTLISNFAYPIIHPNKKEIVKELTKEGIENRPLIAGNIATQPFFKKYPVETDLNFAKIVDEYGFYVPNNHVITKEEIIKICNIINKKISE